MFEIDTWKDRCEDTVQAYDEDMIRDMKRSEVEDEVRKQVDVLMREELDMLKIVSQTPFKFTYVWKHQITISNFDNDRRKEYCLNPRTLNPGTGQYVSVRSAAKSCVIMHASKLRLYDTLLESMQVCVN